MAMKSEPKTKLGRRDFLRALGAGAGVVVATAAPLATQAAADTENNDEKRKARYKADSAEVQTYYRVNRYPS
jgi:nitrous oxide reductase